MREVGFNEQQPVYGYNQNSHYSNGYPSSNTAYSFHPPLIQASNHSQGMDGYQSEQPHYNQYYGPPTQYGGYPNNHYGYHGNNQSYGNYSQNSDEEDNSSIPAYVNYHGQQLPVVMLSSPGQSQGKQNYENQGYGAENSDPQTVTYTQQGTFPPGAEIPDNLPGYPSNAPSAIAAGSGTGQSTYPSTANSGYGTNQSGYQTSGASNPLQSLYGMLNTFSTYLGQTMSQLTGMMSGQQGSQNGTTNTGNGITQGIMGQGPYTSLGGGQQSQVENIQQLQIQLAQAIAEYQAGNTGTTNGSGNRSNLSALQALIAQAANEASNQGSNSQSSGNSEQQLQVQQLLALIQQAQGAANSGSQSPTYPQQQTGLATSGVTGGTGGVDLGSFLSSLAQMSNPGAGVLNASPAPGTTTSTSQPNSFSRMLTNNIYQYYNNDV